MEIVYVNSGSSKISDRMHLLDYVATYPDQFSIDCVAYVDMYLTSAKRLYVCTESGEDLPRVNQVGRELSDEELEQKLVDRCGSLIIAQLTPHNAATCTGHQTGEAQAAVSSIQEEYK